MRKSTPNSPHQPPEYSRDWGEYMVKAVFSEKLGDEKGAPWLELSADEITAYKESINSEFECQVFLLSTPIIVNTDEVTEIITLRDGERLVRIYPPFPVNEKGETSGALDGIGIPEGQYLVTGFTPIPSSAVKGVRIEPRLNKGTFWCRGMRLDVQAGTSPSTIIERLLEQICQYTHQWWIRAPHNPFLGMKRLGATIGKDFRVTQELRHQGGGQIESAWYGAVQSQVNLGIGSPLTKGTWRLACIHTGDGRRADQGILAFHDGFASYMARQDEKCILNLSLAMEIMLNKHRMAVQKKGPEKLEKLLRVSPLMDEETRDALKNLIIDRGHVAHGREPHLVGRDSRTTLESYIGAVRKLISNYLASIPQGQWPDIMNMQISRNAQGPLSK